MPPVLKGRRALRLPTLSLPAVSLLALLLAACQLDLGICPTVDDSTVALYLFDEKSGAEVHSVAPTGAPDGHCTWPIVTRTVGPCGGALHIPASASIGQTPTETGYIVIPSHPLWRLDQGAVELWVRFEALTGSGVQVQGILSRDAKSELDPGHLFLARVRRADGANVLALRLQDGDAATTDQSLCTVQPISEKIWHRIGIDFGGGRAPEIFVDGELQASDTTSGTIAGLVICGTTAAVGIAGNDEPWVLGALDVSSDRGSPTPVSAGLGGTIAGLRISSTRRGGGG